MEQEVVFHFAQGIPGFEHIHKFVLEEIEPELPMRLLKATDEEAISLLVASPFIFYSAYEWELSATDKNELRIQSQEDIEVWSIITVPSNSNEATINLMAPIVLNKQQMLGKQLILHESGYSPRAPLNAG